MLTRYLLLCVFLLSACSAFAQSDKGKTKKPPTVADKIEGMTAYEGFFDFYWSEAEGNVYLAIEKDRFSQDFLYVNSLSAGLGSNDIGLDRNQLGNNRVVHFERSGPKVLLLERNLDYRAVSDNADERQSVEDAFARSAIAGFTVAAESANQLLIDLTPLLLTDAHGVARRLKANKQGTFKVDPKRSAVYLARTKNFPKNSEFEALITFTGEATGSQLRSVAPTADAFSLRLHHSFVELPDDGYEPRVFDPRSGYFPLTYADYATPIDQPLHKRFIQRHRLAKKDPAAAVSDPVEPIVYYLDRGAPEPIRSALIEGAGWWNQAFTAAGYRNAFQVRLLPADADPLDVRYNVINWVHRSTRGWSYGSSVIDPRTGEILKGHVLLGSLRVRQDFLIAQGLVAAYSEDGDQADPVLLEMALARLRQLSAHEVGHTIGLAHNFSASTNGRASVMDYPHPYVVSPGQNPIDFSQAYAVGIGEWDKRTVLYGYQDFPAGTNEKEALQNILRENEKMGLRYLSDADARPAGGAHPEAHLWDNGSDPVAELARINQLRRESLEQLSLQHLANGTPVSELEKLLVPVYLMHRYQVEAVAKIVGGVRYDYGVRTADNQVTQRAKTVPSATQLDALTALLHTLEPGYLEVPTDLAEQLLPPALGYRRDRESFPTSTAPVFDQLAAADAAANHTLTYLLHPQRLARIHQQHGRSEMISLTDYLNSVEAKLLEGAKPGGPNAQRQYIGETVHHRYVQHLLQLTADEKTAPAVRGITRHALNNLSLNQLSGGQGALLSMLRDQFIRNPEAFSPAPAPRLPDGSPIGCSGPH